MLTDKTGFMALERALSAQAERLNAALTSKDICVLLCSEEAAAAAEDLLFAHYEQKQAHAVVLCCEKAEHAADRIKEKGKPGGGFDFFGVDRQCIVLPLIHIIGNVFRLGGHAVSIITFHTGADLAVDRQ